MPRNRHSVYKNVKHHKNSKTRKNKLTGGQSIKSPEKELYDSYVDKFVNKYLTVEERLRFPKLSDSSKDYKIELLMLPKDPAFKTKSLTEKAESIKKILTRPLGSTSSSSKSNIRSTSTTSSRSNNNQNLIGLHDVNAGFGLADDFDMCNIL